ncbi:energy transducer TonB [Aquabacterium sp.]|uniref:energy transducer TonB family protein n=1 Tax=Aquabacterium sp. TaxID=1872578 RepID=UPI0035B08CEB
MNWLRKLTTLQIALGVSVTVHVALLAFRIVDPEGFNKLFDQTPLEVVLVNAKSDTAPDKAQAIAQHHLEGGGEADAGMVSSPLPPSPSAEVGDSPDTAARQMQQLQQQQNELLAQIRRELAAMPPPDPRKMSSSQQAQAEQERRRQLLDMLAAIEKRINEENSRPKKRYLSPATRESSEAIYYDQFRRKVEHTGTANFPTAGGKKLYGELVMLVWLNKGGQVIDTEIAQSSGSKALDKRAAAIVRAAGPEGARPPHKRAPADLWAIASRFKFTRDAGVEARLSTVNPEAP